MKKLLIPIIFILATQVTFGQIVGTPLPWKVKGYGGSGKVDSSVYSTKANVNHVTDSLAATITTGTVTYVKQGYGINVDSSSGNKYTVSADTTSTHGLVSKDRLANLSDSVGLYFPLRKDSTGKNQYIDTFNLRQLRYSLANRDTTKWTDTTLTDRKFLTARINAIPSGSGGLLSSNFVFGEVPSGSVNGSNVTFVLANTPVVGKVAVYLNGLLQEVGGGNDYTISGGTITYTTAPITGDVLLVNYIK